MIALPEALQKGAVLAFTRQTLHRRANVDPFLLFHVEADVVDALIAQEGIHLLRLTKGFFREHGNGMERDSMGLQRANAVHGAGMGALPIAETPMGIMERFRPIHTHANHDAIALEALRPVVVDQRGIGLYVLLDHHPLPLQLFSGLLQPLRGLVIKSGGQRQRLSGVPQDRKIGPPIGALINPAEQQRKLLKIKHPPLLTVGQVAVAAVEVAKGGGLDHHQANRTEISGIHQFANPPR